MHLWCLIPICRIVMNLLLVAPLGRISPRDDTKCVHKVSGILNKCRIRPNLLHGPPNLWFACLSSTLNEITNSAWWSQPM